MSANIIKFDLKELRKLVSDKNSCVFEKRVTQNLALQPWCLGNLKESLKSLLDYKIGKFVKDFNGILLSYKNLRILQNIGTIRNDNSDIMFQVQADYFIFKPHAGAILKGIVNKKSVTHLGILVHRVFNVVIPRPTEQPGNKWVGSMVQEGQEVTFRVVVLDLFGALPYIRGELDGSWSKQGSYGDEEQETKGQTYVNFDKTKPTGLKDIGDGLNHVPKLPGKSIDNKFFKNGVASNSQYQHKPSTDESNVSVSEKNRPLNQQRLFKRHRRDF